VSGAEGRGEDNLVLDWAARQVEIDPFYEPAHRQAMRALARSGRRSQAAAYYQRLQSRFQDALGLPPEPETQALDRAIRANDPLDSPLREVRGLPAPVNPLVGRTVEISELETWLSDPARRLINVTGPGGIGKTRLVIEVAKRLAPAFADGGLYLFFTSDLAPGALSGVMADSLGIPAGDISAYLREKDLLMLLDGCEHILQDRGIVTRLLEAAPRLVVLAASRERLGLPGEWIFGLGGLEVPPLHMNEQIGVYSAVALFEQSARQVWAGFHLTPENRPAIGEICRLVSGVPLALNLAAAWVSVLPVTEITEQIRRSLDILAVTPCSHNDPHASIRAVLEQSWQRLDPRERSAFMRLVVFQDGFDRDAAAQVAGASLQDLARLVDTSFLYVTGENRYGLHDLLHQFAAEKLAQSGAEKTTRKDHFCYFLNLARQNEAGLRGPDALKAFLWLSRESANLQSALIWAQQNDSEAAGFFSELIRQGIHQTGMHQFSQFSLDRADEARTLMDRL
jgi:predicted ATPase